MYSNGQCYIWLPTCLTFNRLSEQATAIVNAVHSQIGKPLLSVGDTNPYYLDLNDLDMGGAPFTRDAEPLMAVCGPIENLAHLDLDYVSLIFAFGNAANQLYPDLNLYSEIECMEVWFEIDDPSDDCPLEPGTIWADWKKGDPGANTELAAPKGEKYYRSSANYNKPNSGRKINASAWVPAYMAGQLTVLSGVEMAAIRKANETLPG